jgi:hypothetical protein
MFRRLPLALLPLAIACEFPTEGDLDVEDPIRPEAPAAAPGTDDTIMPRDDGDADSNFFVAPEGLEVQVGDDVVLDVVLRDPTVGTVLVEEIPQRADWESIEAGCRVTWRPTLPDIGEHAFVFSVVVSDGDVVVARREIDVIVLGPHALVEYGF